MFARKMIRLTNPTFYKVTQKHCSAASNNGGLVSSLKSRIEVPTWGAVMLAATTIGYFGKGLHDDNLQTRQELQAGLQANREELQAGLQANRQELQEGLRENREEIRKLSDKMVQSNRKIV